MKGEISLYSIDTLTVNEFLDKLAAPSFPGPASGSAAGTAAAMAAALFEMSCAATLKKDEQKRELVQAIIEMKTIRLHCLAAATDDMKAYAEVVKAIKVKQEAPEQYELAMKNATDTLVAIVNNCEWILTRIEKVLSISYIKVLGDLGGSACLAEAAAAAAKLGVDINLRLLRDQNYKDETKAAVRESYLKCAETKARIVKLMAQ